MNVIICDDQSLVGQKIKQVIEENSDRQFIKVQYINDPKLLTENIEKLDSREPVVLLMDIELGQVNGIKYASIVQQKFKAIKIVFITGYIQYSEFIFDGVSPSGFLKKPIKKEKLMSLLNRIYLQFDEAGKMITIKTIAGEIPVILHNISYIESYKRTVIYHIDGNEYTAYNKLDNVAEELPDYFVRCHTSYIINLNYITDMKNNAFTLQDGKVINISKKFRNSAREHYFRFKGLGTL